MNAVIVTLRDPMDRAFSHHLHEIAKGHIPACAFADAVGDNPEYLEQRFYGRHLTTWFSAFPRDRILVLFTDEIRADRQAAADKVHRFLGLESATTLDEARNVSDRARSPLLRRGLRAGGDTLRRAGGRSMGQAYPLAPGA